MSKPRAADNVASGTHNLFRSVPEGRVPPPEVSAPAECLNTSAPNVRPGVKGSSSSRRASGHVAGLPRPSTGLAPNYGAQPEAAESLDSVVGSISPAPPYTTQDYADHLLSELPSPSKFDEKAELRDSPAQEQYASLPFERENVPKMSGVGSCEDLNMEKAIPHLVAIHTTEFERYERAYCYPERFYEKGNPTIRPLTRSFEGDAPPEGWKVFIHPEGTRYFYCDHPDNPVPVLTDAWIFDEEQYAQIDKYMGEIFRYMVDHRIPLHNSGTSRQYVSPSPLTKLRYSKSPPTNGQMGDSYPQYLAPTVLVLDTRLTGNVGYYFVSHPTQTLFWLDPFDYSYAVHEVHTDHTQTLIGLEMKRHYWLHNELFPHLYELEKRDIEEVDDMVEFALGDALTSRTGVVGMYSQEQLKQMECIIHRHDAKGWERRRRSVGARRTICRILANFYHERFLNLHGERGSRLNSTQSVHYSPRRRMKYITGPLPPQPPQPWYKRLFRFVFEAKSRSQCKGDDEVSIEADPPINPGVEIMHHNSTLLGTLSGVMFGGPGYHARKLRDMTRDRLVRGTALEKYREKMVEEWRDVTLYGAVLLGANVSFLGIQSVDDAGQLGSQRTGSQRASYFSIMASIGAILSSFMLAGRHRDVMNISFVANRSNTRWGLESLALVYGTPFSLAIWSITSFLVSFAILWFDNTDHVVMALVGSFSLILAFFLLWPVLATYETQPYESFFSQAAHWVRKMTSKVGREFRFEPHPQPAPTGPTFAAKPASWTSIGLVGRTSGVYSSHQRSWSDASSSTVLGGDEDQPGPTKSSLDLGRPSTGKGARSDHEGFTTWSEKAPGSQV